jgi:hypothetical protein
LGEKGKRDRWGEWSKGGRIEGKREEKKRWERRSQRRDTDLGRKARETNLPLRTKSCVWVMPDKLYIEVAVLVVTTIDYYYQTLDRCWL